MLHTFNKPQVYIDNQPYVAPDDQILFIEDGVYALLGDEALNSRSEVYALEIDVEARGLSKKIRCKVISYEDFVTLCVETDQIKNWF
jgi:sulfur relay protein TusB/DsrH